MSHLGIPTGEDRSQYRERPNGDLRSSTKKYIKFEMSGFGTFSDVLRQSPDVRLGG